MLYKIRFECIFCENIINKSFFKEDKYIYISSNICEKISNTNIPYNVLSCNNCGCYQNKYLGNIDLVYNDNHNNVIISDIWIKHYDDFYKFIIDSKKILNNFNILEIGAGNNYIVNLFCKNNYNNYTILEPVITNKIEGVNYISGWLEEYTVDKQFDITILSHVFEHLYYPKDLFKIKSRYIALSIPNIPKYLDNFILNFLNIEHTYYFEEDHIITLFNNNKYKLINKLYFQNHSIFLLFENDTELKTILYSKINTTIDKKIDLYFNNIFKLIDNINNYTKSNNKKFAIFPSNMYIQYLICLGLNTDKIEYFYDNNNNKLDKYLYGTNIICKNLNFYIENNEYEIILLGFLYNQEIREILEKNNIKYYMP
jgi:hypothetical protein